MSPFEAQRFVAPAHWRAIDIISDLHLDAEHPSTFDAWQRFMMQTSADAVLMLGDIFEAWVGDDARTEGFERRCAEVLTAVSTQRRLAFMPGNRDFLVGDAMLQACGVQRLADPTLLVALGQSALLTHGDALCIADTDYQRFRTMVRDPAWQRAALARPLADRRAIARQMRHASETIKATSHDPQDWTDIDKPTAVDWLRAADTSVMVHGHTHRPGSDDLVPGFRRHVLSDWDLDAPTPRADVLRLTPSGFERIGLEHALAA